MVALLRALAERKGVTVLATLHAPSAQVYALCHSALYLAPGGWSVWQGRVGQEGQGFGGVLAAALAASQAAAAGVSQGGGAGAMPGKALPLPLPRPPHLTLPPGKSAPSWVLECVAAMGVGGGQLACCTAYL